MSDRGQTESQLLAELSELKEKMATQSAQLRQARQALADQRQINNRLPVLLATANRDGYYAEVNPAFKQILGWSEQESLSRPFMEFIHPDDHAVAIETFERLKAGETIADFVDRNLCKDGSFRWIKWIVIPVLDRGIVFGIGQDITEQKEAEAELEQAHADLERRVAERTEELRQSNVQLSVFKAFVEASAQGFGMADMDGRIVYGNAAIARLVGEERAEDSYGKLPDVYYTEDYEELREGELFPGYRNGEAWRGEVTMVSKSGEHIPALQTSFTVLDQDEKPLRRGVVITDLREIKQKEEALRKEQESLRRMLRASDHERQLISYDIHDGLAQFLGAATMQFQLFEHLRESEPHKAKTAFDAGCELVQQAHSEARRLISGVRPPVLDEAGVAVAISHLVHEAKEPKGPQVVYYDDVEFDRLSAVLENAIYRIVQEAVTNACQHSQSEKVKVSLVQEGDNLRLEIQDWGKGFDPGAVGRNRFGLEGIRERTRLFGGDCAIESEAEKGTCIRVTLPIVKET